MFRARGSWLSFLGGLARFQGFRVFGVLPQRSLALRWCWPGTSLYPDFTVAVAAFVAN